MEQFSYTRGKSKYIDFLCDSNKLILLSDTNIIDEKLKTLYEEELQFPAKDIVVLITRVNISNAGTKKLIAKFDSDKIHPIKHSRSMAFLTDKYRVICDGSILILPWQRLIELLDDIDIVALMDPLQTK